MENSLTTGKTIRLSSKLRGKIYILNKETTRVLRKAYGENIKGSIIKNEHGAENDFKNLFGTYMLRILIGNEEVLVLFYRTISSYEEVEQQLNLGGLQGLLEHAASIVYNGTGYIGHEDAGTKLKKALVNGFNPAVWLLIDNNPHDLRPLKEVYMINKTRSGVHIFYYNWRSLVSKAAAQLRKGQFQVKMPNGVRCTITKGDDDTYLFEFNVQGTFVEVEYSRIEKLRHVLDYLLSDKVPPWHIKSISIAGKRHDPDSAMGRAIRTAVSQNIRPLV